MKLPNLKGALTDNWPQKTTAILLAGVLWALTEAEEPTTQLVPVRMEITPPAGRALTFSLPRVQALYSGPARELIKLFASPPTISLQIPDSASSPEFLLTLSPNDLVLAIDASVQPLDVQPRRITLTLDDMGRKSVPVVTRVSIEPDAGYELIGGVSVSPDSIVITGPTTTVDRVDTVFTVPFERDRVRAPISEQVAIDTASLGNLRLSPVSVNVSAEVGRIAERVLSGVLVEIEGGAGIDWIADPAAVAITARGPSTQLTSLARDSLRVVALPLGEGEREMLRLTVSGPAGLEFEASPDSVVVQRREGS